MFTQHLGMVFKRKGHFLDAVSRLTRHLTEVEVFIHIRRNIDAPGHTMTPYDSRRRNCVYIGHVGQSHLRAFGSFNINQQVANGGQVGAHLRHPPHHHVKYFLILEQGPDGDARHHRGCGAAHVTGFEAVNPGFVEVYLDFNRCLVLRDFGARILDALNFRQHIADLLGFGPDDANVMAIHPHRELVVRAGNGAPELLGEEGSEFARHAGVLGDRFAHGVHGVVVVCGRIDADPDFRRVDVLGVGGEDRPADVSGCIAHTLDGAQILDQRACRPVHGRQRCARGTRPLDQHIGFLETRYQRTLHLRQYQVRDRNRNQPGNHDRHGPPYGARGDPFVGAE